MVGLYTEGFHAKEMEKVDKSIVDILTGKTPCSIELLDYIDMDSVECDLNKAETTRTKELAKSGRVETKTLAINYAEIHPTTPPTIIDVDNNRGYNPYLRIGEENKIMTKFETYSGVRFYDGIKINPENRFIYEGTFEEILDEFRNAGFNLKESLSQEELTKYQDLYHEEHSD